MPTDSACAISYSGDGTTTVFPFSFPVQSVLDLQVTITDTTQNPVVVTILQPSQYSVAGIGNPAGGSVTTPLTGSPLAVGVTLTLRPAVQVPLGCGTDPTSYLTTILTAENAAVASAAACAAAASAAQAATSATASQAGATSAATSAGSASTSATGAADSAATAANQANAAATSATNAATAASAAGAGATAAQDSATAAATAAGNAASAATAAEAAATNAATAANSASTSAGNAATSATDAASSAASALAIYNDTAEMEAAVSAAATSATAAAGSATSASGSATTATTQAGNASTAATNAADSATAAANSASNAAGSATAAAASAAAMSGSSTTALAIATGSQTLVTQSGKYFTPGTWLLIASGANPANYMHGQVTAYSGTSLTVDVTDVGGSGSHADWTITVSGTQAPGSVVSVNTAGLATGGPITSTGTITVTPSTTAQAQAGTDTTTAMTPAATAAAIMALGYPGNMVNSGASTAGHIPRYSDATGTALQDGYAVGTSGGVVPLLNGANTYGAPQTAGAQALTDAGTVGIAITQQIWTLSTGGARTIANPSGGVTNTCYRLVVATGGYSPAWGANFKFPGGTAPSGLSGTCIFDFWFDGTYYHCTGQTVNG